MQYAKLIKHPLPPIKAEYVKYFKEKNIYGHVLYHAEIIDGVLAVTLFQRPYSKEQIEIDSRHFYDGEKYATQRVSDNKRLSGALSSYLTYYSNGVGNSDKIIESYVKKAVSEEVYKKCRCSEGLTTLYYVEQNMLEEALKLRHKKITDKVDRRMAALSEKPPQEFFNWVKDWVLKEARYFFYSYQKKKTQKGYCSHCQSTFEAADVRNNAKTRCPNCGSWLTCKPSGKSPERIYDYVSASYIEEITENGIPTLVERIFAVKQEIQGHREGVEEFQKNISYCETHRQFFYATTLNIKSDSQDHNFYAYGWFRNKGKQRWCANSDCYGAYKYIAPKIFPQNLNSIFKRCQISQLQNIEVSAITPWCMIGFEELVMYLNKLPVLENFAKLGFYNLLQDIVDHYFTEYSYLKNHIKSGSKTVYGTLGISKDVMNKLGNIGMYDYLLYKKLVEIAPIKIETFKRYSQLGISESNNSYIALNILKDYKISFEKFIGFLEKQCRLVKENVSTVLNTYRDYLSMVKDLRIPKTESVLFPKNVNVEHDRVMKIKTDKTYKRQNAKLKKRVKILELLSYEDEEFLIRPLRSSSDFLNESSVLNHCVKTYIDRCARGETNIFGIRKTSDPETPYFTLQLSNDGKVITNLGKNNCQPPKKVNDFVRKWKRKVIAKNQEKFIEAASNKPQKVKVTA